MRSNECEVREQDYEMTKKKYKGANVAKETVASRML